MRKLIFLIFGVLLPVGSIVILFLLPSTTKIPIRNEAREDGSVVIILTQRESGFFKSLDVLRQALQVPFDLSRYNIFLKNKTNIEGPELGKINLEVDAVLVDQSLNIVSKPIRLPVNEAVKVNVTDRPLRLRIAAIQPFVIPHDLPAIPVTTSLDVFADEDMGAQPVLESRIISSIIFMVAYGALINTIQGFIRWYKRSFYTNQ